MGRSSDRQDHGHLPPQAIAPAVNVVKEGVPGLSMTALGAITIQGTLLSLFNMHMNECLQPS